MKKGKGAALKQKAAYFARPLYARPKDMHKLKGSTTLRNEHLLGQAMLHKQNERERISAMIHTKITPALRETLIKNRSLIK